MTYCGGYELRVKRSSRGIPYAVWEPVMPRIDDEMQECAVYLYPSVAAAEAGERIGGSGFIVGVPSDLDANVYHPYAVTNKHVIEGGSPVVRLNSTEGVDILDIRQDSWFCADEDDIAVCPVVVSEQHHAFRFVPLHMFISREIIAEHKIGVGNEVFLVSRLISHEGKQRNQPVLRFGNISLMPHEPLEYQGHKQESFVVELRSIAGHSGSPVFVYWIHSYPVEGKPVTLAKQWLLGVDWCHLRDLEDVYKVENGELKTTNYSAASNTGMAGVVPAWKLRDLLEREDLMKIRKEASKKAKNLRPQIGPSLDAAEKPFTRDDFEAALKQVSKRLPASQSDEEKSKT